LKRFSCSNNTEFNVVRLATSLQVYLNLVSAASLANA